jgi:DNA repair photolyase
MIRTHPVFRRIGVSAFQCAQAIVDPQTPERIRNDAGNFGPGDVVMACTISGLWSPEAQARDLGRRCLEILLETSCCQLRILTKNAAIKKNFDLIARHAKRVHLGLSITAPVQNEWPALILEPPASLISERLEAMHVARQMGIHTYGMLCPCLPGIADDVERLDAMMSVVLECGAEDIWIEPVNPRGNGLIQCETRLRDVGETQTAQTIHAIRNMNAWSRYVRELSQNAVHVARQHGILDRLHIMIYPKRLQAEDRHIMEKLPGIIWLE